MNYYRNTFLVLAGVFFAAIGLLGWASAWKDEQKAELLRITAESLRSEEERRQVDSAEKLQINRIEPLRKFTQAWAPFIRPALARDLGNYIRNGMATLATRTGLTSEGATVPQDAKSYTAGDRIIRVQQVSLNVISESLPAALTWLGAVEEHLPYGRVESLSISGYASRSVQLSLTVVHPVEESHHVLVTQPGTTL